MGKRDFARARHVAFFDAMATELPGDYAPQEVNHLTLGYFAVGGLSLLRELDRVRSCRRLHRDAVFYRYASRITWKFRCLEFYSSSDL